MDESSVILQRIFLAIEPCFYIQGISQSNTSRWIVLLCNDIAQAQSRMVNFKTIMMWDLTQTKKKSKLSNTWSTVCWITFSMYSWSMVNLPNASVCWETRCVDDQQNSRFPPLSKFPNWMMMDWLYLVEVFLVRTTAFVSCGSLAS